MPSRPRSRALLAGGALAVTASLGAVLAGMVGTGPLVAPAAAAELQRFGGCEELRQWYVARALPQVGPWGLGGPLVGGLERDVASSAVGEGAAEAGRATADQSTPDQAVGSSSTGTTVQEVGVDEPDRAKTDGNLLVHVTGRTLVVTDVSGEHPVERSRLDLPQELHAPEVLLAGDTALVVASSTTGHPRPVEPGPASSRVADIWLPGGLADRSRLVAVSLADPAAPRIVSDRTLGGSLLAARAHDSGTGSPTVRLVLRTSTPTIDFVLPDRDRSEAEAREVNRRLVRESTIEDWLPSVRVGGGAAAPLVACDDVRRPAGGPSDAGYQTVTILTLPAASPERATTTAVTTESDTVYVSSDGLYLAVPDESSQRTAVHAFALDGATTSYTASGSVDGVVADRWAMDEHDGVLRLAVAHLGKGWETLDNGVVTLRERGTDLVPAGTVRGLGPEEEIKSVRWFDDLAVVVTFRQTDPLYTVDLTDPARPRTLGQLKIPGFSDYLHPVGGDLLLGIGYDATDAGETLGGQLSLFDIADLTDPRRLATLPLGTRETRSAAGWDPRSLTWMPAGDAGTGTLLTAVADDLTGRSWMAEFRVDGAGSAGPGSDGAGSDGAGFVVGRTFALPDWSAETGRALPLGHGRVAVVGDSVEVVEVVGVEPAGLG